MRPGRDLAAVSDRRPDGGFTLIEVVVGLAVLSLVMAATSVFFTRSLGVTHVAAQRQQAVQLAADGLEKVRGLAASALITRRGQAAVQAQWNAAPAAVSPALAAAQPVWDTDAVTTSGADAPLPTSPTTSGKYTRQWYVGSCWLLLGGTDCNLTNKTSLGSFDMYRVVVAVSWANNQCTANMCWLLRSTLIATDDTEPEFPTATATPTPAPTTAAPTPTPAPTTAAPTPSPTPAPAVPGAIWATRTQTSAVPVIDMTNSTVAITGIVHSNADVKLNNTTGSITPRLEVGTTVTMTNSTMSIAATTYGASGSAPGARNIADYRPGGSAAVAAGSAYKQATCSSGSWTYNASQVTGASIVYANCNVTIGSNNITAAQLIVAEGTITVTGNNTVVGVKTNAKATGLLSASALSPAITIGGGSTQVYGSVQAPNGQVLVQSSATVMHCGIIGDSIRFNNASALTLSVPSTCY